jgi:sulfur dioxygenase
MQPLQLFDPATSTYTYVLVDPLSRAAIIIDPVDTQLERDLALLQARGLSLVWTLETHTHADHITSAGQLAEHAGAKTAVPAGCGISSAAVQLQHGDCLPFGSETVQALHTPGHTAGSMSFVWRNHVFSGDTLLIGGCGRTDFQSGSAEAMFHSLTHILFALPPESLVWPGHDYHGKTHSSIGAEKAHNPRIAHKTLSEFMATMDALNLPRPQRMDQAVPANLVSGLSHEASPLPPDIRPAEGYAGDVSPQLACLWWQAGEAVLVDVRTDAERTWVGEVPGAVPLAWKQWPGMAMNADFDTGLQAALAGGKKAVLLCRSGVRSVAAAKRATELGLEAYNILEGFEGDPDGEAHRGRKGGWRFHNLPWRQS